MNAPHAFESHFNQSELQVLSQLAFAKGILDEALENDDMVKSIMASCEANGLVLIDQLRVLCANLINQHKNATSALLNMDCIIKELRQQVAAPPMTAPRKIIETWRSSADLLYCRCDDGTVWSLTRTDELPQWQLDRKMGAPIPQWSVI